GKFARGSSVMVKRDGKVIIQSNVSSLKRFKDDVKEVNTGMECGVGVDKFDDFKVGDILETYHKTKST
ncbi:MAG: hypothetical protein U1D67_01000, partial [Dehalococcoidia bacterium]|nr:hypothetical protein [Dehalococcoidia bacterium]